MPAATVAASYPEGTVRLVVPYPPGGPTDIAGRLVADELGKALGASFIVENKPGGGGMHGADQVARARPHGEPLLVNASAHGLHLATFKKVPFEVIDDLPPVNRKEGG